MSSQLSLGTGLLNATVRDVGADALFFSWLGQVQRVQVLSPDIELRVDIATPLVRLTDAPRQFQDVFFYLQFDYMS